MRTMMLLAAGLAGCGDDSDDFGDADSDSDTDTDSDTDGDTDTDTGSGTGTDSDTDTGTGDDCGTEVLPTDDIFGTEGIAIAPDGTLYYSQSEAVGRRVPGGAVEDAWVPLPGADTVWGLVLGDDGMLYVGSPSTQTVYRIDTAAAPATAENFVTGAGAPNGLAIAADGTVYWSDFSGGRVYREDGGSRAEVTTSGIPQANGILFDDDGTLLVLSYGSGNIYRLTLAGGVETDRVPEATVDGALDGIGMDDAGRIYVTDNGLGRLLRLSADFGPEEEIGNGMPQAAGIAWGKGALRCEDVYVASGGTLGIYNGDTPGRP